jgi:lysophospholipase L1-like esterase
VTRLGVLALGDSITNGGGELQWGVALQSWAQWLARGLNLPFTSYAADGATVRDVLAEQVPAADPGARYDVGALYIGVNDVRSPHWDPQAYAQGFDQALAWLTARAQRTLVCTIPLDLGRPRASERVAEANRIIEDAARRHGALVVDLRDFRARNHVMVDAVHPTAFGQVAIAERALDVLAAGGLPPRLRPHTLLSPAERTRWRALRGDATYAYRQAKQVARTGARLLALKARRGRGAG